MTSQLLILGNGFDLHCGLKSSYKDFFLREIIDTTNARYGLAQIKRGVVGFWEELLVEYYKTNKNLVQNWCDIETIIKETLWQIFFGNIGPSNYTNNDIGKLALSYEKDDSISWDKKLDSNNSIILFLFRYCLDFFARLSLNEKNCSDQVKLHLILERLLVELHNFEERFCKYIKGNIVNPENEKELNKQYIVNAVNLFAKLTGFSTDNFEDIDDIISVEEERYWELVKQNLSKEKWKSVNVLSNEFTKLKNTYILSFNYTALFDILGVESPCVYSNVHGKLCNEKCKEFCSASSIIFGIDDTLIQSQSKYNDLRLFSKTYRKMFNTSAPVSVLPSNDVPVDIKFYGHSLSEADYSYFQSIFDYYNIYGNNNVSLLFYYSEGFEQTDAIYRLINSYGKTLTNQEQGKNLMHKLLLENRLKIVKIT